MPRPARTLAAVLLATAALATAGCAGKADLAQGEQRVAAQDDGGVHTFARGARSAAPELGGQTLDGRSLDVAAYRGKIVVLNYWASWCSPCVAEADALEQLATETAADGVQFVGVDFRNDQRSNAKAFVAAHHLTYPMLYDADGSLALAWRGKVAVRSVPTTLVLDRAGRVAAAIYGGPLRYTTLKALLAQLTAERA